MGNDGLFVHVCRIIKLLIQISPQPFLDVVCDLSSEEVEDLLLIIRVEQVELDEFLEARAEVGMIDNVGRIATTPFLLSLPKQELMKHDLHINQFSR
jgi:hypothetical protein